MMFKCPVGPRSLDTPNRILNTQSATQLKLHIQVIIVPKWFCEFSDDPSPSTGQPKHQNYPQEHRAGGSQ